MIRIYLDSFLTIVFFKLVGKIKGLFAYLFIIFVAVFILDFLVVYISIFGTGNWYWFGDLISCLILLKKDIRRIK